jgi:hypothetical protein
MEFKRLLGDYEQLDSQNNLEVRDRYSKNVIFWSISVPKRAYFD